MVGATQAPGERWIAPVAMADAQIPQAPPAGEAPAEPLLAAPQAQALAHDDMRAGIVAKGFKEPAIPTPAEVAEHELTHLPSKPWCEHCIRGRGRDAVHRSLNERVDEVLPVIEMDYFFMTDAKHSQTGLAAVCRSTGYLFASAVTEKGPRCLREVPSGGRAWSSGACDVPRVAGRQPREQRRSRESGPDRERPCEGIRGRAAVEDRLRGDAGLFSMVDLGSAPRRLDLQQVPCAA